MYFSTPFLYNLLVVKLNEILFVKVSISPQEFDTYNKVIKNDPLFEFQRVFSFALPSFCGIIYSIPLWKDFFQKNSPSYKSKIRIANAALFSGMIGFLGWFIGLVYTLYSFISHKELEVNWLFKQITYFLFEMILCFSLVYYTLDSFNRNYVFPKVLENHEILELEGRVSLKITQKFFIYFLTSVLMPITFLVGIVWKLIYNPEGETYTVELILSIALILIFSATLTYYIIQNLIQPITKLKAKAISIQEGNFGNPILVTSTDEIGELTKAINQMSSSLQEKEKIKDIFGRSVDPKVRDLLIQNKIQLGGELQTASILFCDIRGFTHISEKLEPKQVVLWLNQYFQRMEECISSESGIINKFIGDAILAIFGIPIDVDNPSLAAVKCALKMKDSLTKLNTEFVKENLPEIRFGIGIHTGKVLAGSVGSFSRSEYTVIGDTVNISSRIENLCKEYNTFLLFTEQVKENILPFFENIKFLGNVDIRGRENKINLYTLIQT